MTAALAAGETTAGEQARAREGGTTPLLQVRNIETYYGPIMAIRGVSFDVLPGQIVTILGASGAGKTTILKTVAGVMDPQKGSVTFEGREIQKMDPDQVVRLGKIGRASCRGRV